MTSQSGSTSPDSIGKSRKRKRSIADGELFPLDSQLDLTEISTSV